MSQSWIWENVDNPINAISPRPKMLVSLRNASVGQIGMFNCVQYMISIKLTY